MEPIEKDVVLEADADRVWRALTNKDELSNWMMMPTNFNPKVGAKFYFQANPNEEWTSKVTGKVKELDKNEKLSFTWNSDQLSKETLVTFTLSEKENKTKLKLIHSGWEETEDDENNMRNLYNEGWGQRLFENLKELVSQKFIV
jgi:uncharacterized protein YndB with AHSA1/START domain